MKTNNKKSSNECGGYRPPKGHMDTQMYPECEGTPTDRNIVKKTREKRKDRKKKKKKSSEEILMQTLAKKKSKKNKKDPEKFERCVQDVKKKQAFNLKQYKVANKWHDNSEGPTDKGNEVGNWTGGWLKGEWKCPRCGTMIGRNLRGQIPFAFVEQHKKNCDK